jgi:toxin-antitoxin system PIN domain toxin
MSEILAWLPDVNVLVALLDPGHIHHEAAHRWWAGHKSKPWATCALTENGLIRVLTQPRYPNRLESISQAIALLRGWKEAERATHQWWSSEVSLTDQQLFASDKLAGPGQVTDVFLLGLARHHRGRVVSFDRSLPWEAVVGGSSELVELLS